MKNYKIVISGYGGETVFGKATLQQFEFWNNEERLKDAGFDDSDTALTTYMLDIEEWETAIPKTARLNKEWYEIDDYGHFSGCTYESAYIRIQELESLDEYATSISNVWQGELTEFIKCCNASLITEELNLDETIDERFPHVFYGMSVEKGDFFISTFVSDQIDFSKFKFYFTDLPNGDVLLDNVEYNQKILDNLGGDTVGKKDYMEIWDW